MLSSLGTGVVLALLFNVYWLLKQKEYDSNDDENYINNNLHSTLFQTLFIVSFSPHRLLGAGATAVPTHREEVKSGY